jgi:methyl-accepting chemotaxis protein
MDKLTQQNAANAEESASASEELSAQAEQMQGMVGELVAVIGDSGEAKGLESRSGHQTPKGVRKTPKILSAAISRLKKEPTVKKAKDSMAEAVIPLNDNEFAEF